MADAIRLAGPDDTAVLATLNAAVHDWHVAAYPERFVANPNPVGLAQFFADTIARPGSQIALCERGGEALGFIWIEISERPASALKKPHKQLYVHMLAVVERVRRQGVATALMDWAGERASAQDVDAIALDHWADNAAASAFYAAQGFRPERIVLSRS